MFWLYGELWDDLEHFDNALDDPEISRGRLGTVFERFQRVAGVSWGPLAIALARFRCT